MVYLEYGHICPCPFSMAFDSHEIDFKRKSSPVDSKKRLQLGTLQNGDHANCMMFVALCPGRQVLQVMAQPDGKTYLHI